MCRMFAMSGGSQPIHAMFWLLYAPDSLLAQSYREPDGAGIGWFDRDGQPHVDKDVLPAYRDAEFIRDAMEVESTTCIAHLRYASTGPAALANTHPFEMDGMLFAHNGEIGDLDVLDAHLGDNRSLVRGDTDSECFFALIVQEMDRHPGDTRAAITSSVGWVADTLPVFAMNFVLADAHNLWAFRYPEQHELHVLERPAGGVHGTRHLDAASPAGTIRVHSQDLMEMPSVIVASEPLDENPHWTPLQSGELLHVDEDLHVTRTIIIDHPPARMIVDSDSAGSR